MCLFKQKAIQNIQKIWNEVQDNYLLQLLDKALNCILGSEKKLAEMDDREFAEWLQKQDFRQKPTKAFDVKVPDMTIKSARNCGNCVEELPEKPVGRLLTNRLPTGYRR